MRNTNDSTHIPQSPDHQLIGQNARSVIKPEETVIRENGADTHEVSMKNALMAQ